MRRLRKTFVVSVLGLAGLVVPTSRGQEAEAQAEREKLRGTWQLLYSETDGKPAPIERVRGLRVVMKGDSYSVWSGDQEVMSNITFQIDPTQSPKTTDDTLIGPDNKVSLIHGIYKLEGDSLVSCVGEIDRKRPDDFSTSPGSERTLRVFQKVKEGEPATGAAEREEYMRFGGVWKYESMVVEGQELQAAVLGGSKLVVQGDRFTALDPEATYHGFFRVDPSVSPKTIEITFTDGPEAGTTKHGIYELEADTYRSCLAVRGTIRPLRFAARPGSGQALQVLKRVNP